MGQTTIQMYLMELSLLLAYILHYPAPTPEQSSLNDQKTNY